MIKALFFRYLLKKTLLFAGLAFVSLMSLIGLDFTTYSQLTAQETIFRVSVKESGENKFLVRLTSDDLNKEYLLEGDQWQVDFRLIRFSPVVSMVGASYLYQASRLSNRYVSIEDQRTKPLHFHSLREGKAVSPDLWDYLKKYSNILPMIDTTFGSSVFMPLKADAEYEILIGFSGLVVKATNEEGQAAVMSWH